MRRVMRWLKHLLTGRKEEHKGLEANHAASDWSDGAEQKKRWSFAKRRKSGADGGARQPAVAAATAESRLVRLEEDVRATEEKAAVVIQKTFRGYLARRALRALRSLVKIQALVRGYLVRKQAAMTLHRLQTLMRLQADSIAVKNASYRKSVEQERIFAQEVRMKPPSTPAHRRRLSDSTESNYERSPRIVEMDTCQLRCRSSRITSRYAADPPGASPLLYFQKPASRLLGQELEPPHPKTTHNTPRLGAFPGFPGSPASKSGRGATCRDAGGSPRYMADTASSVARTRWQSAPRQRQGEHAAAQGQVAEPRPSVRRSGSRKQARPQLQALESFSFKSSEASRVEDSELSDEVTRDYYLDRLW